MFSIQARPVGIVCAHGTRYFMHSQEVLLSCPMIPPDRRSFWMLVTPYHTRPLSGGAVPTFAGLMTGFIPPEIAQLKCLKEINLGSNRLTGEPRTHCCLHHHERYRHVTLYTHWFAVREISTCDAIYYLYIAIVAFRINLPWQTLRVMPR